MPKLGPGGRVIWPRRGDVIFSGGEEFLSYGNQPSKSSSIMKPLDILPDQHGGQIHMCPLVSPLDFHRVLFYHIEPTQSLGFSDALQSVAFGSGGGEVTIASLALDFRRTFRLRSRFLSNLTRVLCRWSLHRVPMGMNIKVEDPGNIEGIKQELFLNGCMDGGVTVDLSSDIGYPDEKYVENTTQPDKAEWYDDETMSTCQRCGSQGSAFCWHKLHSYFELRLQIDEAIHIAPQKYDFLNSHLLRITQLSFSPNIGSCTWLAVGTGLGFVNLFCLEDLYLTKMDKFLNRPTGEVSKSIFNNYNEIKQMEWHREFNREFRYYCGPTIRSSRYNTHVSLKDTIEDSDSDATEPCKEKYP